jgi:hypothetical protein
MLESEELEFNAAATIGRPEAKSTIGEIPKASIASDRLTPVLAQMEQIG